MDDIDENIIALASFVLLCGAAVQAVRKKKAKTKRRRTWVRPIFQLDVRKRQSDYYNLMKEMLLSRDAEKYEQYLRMNPEQFQYLVNLVRPHLLKNNCGREPVTVEEKVALTLRYLAEGSSMRSISFSFRLGFSTVSTVIRETCRALSTELSKLHLKAPRTQREFEEISKKFWEYWNFPNCVGAIDGKHIRIEAPGGSGSEYYNYKQFFSLNLLAVCDADYKFLYVDIGSSGSNSDAGIFASSGLGSSLENRSLGLPEPSILPGTSNIKFPYVLVGDDAFPLKGYMMKPYATSGRRFDYAERCYNYRLSRARRVIENTFGILAARWRIFRKPIVARVSTVKLIVQTCCCLHNYLRSFDSSNIPQRRYIQPNMADSDDQLNGLWRQVTANDTNMTDTGRLGSNNAAARAIAYRDILKLYFQTDGGKVPWQESIVNRGSF